MSQSQKEAAEYAEVLMAYSRGENIQMRRAGAGVGDEWAVPTYPLWDFARFEYRVAPKPVERWFWLFPSDCLSTDYKAKESLLLVLGRNEGRPILMREVAE